MVGIIDSKNISDLGEVTTLPKKIKENAKIKARVL
jgi:hypothetical protein